MNSIRQNVLNNVKKLGDFLMKSRREATIIAMLTAVIPFLGWLSLAVLAFVTLRKGAKNGFFILGWSVIPAVVAAYVMNGSVAIAVECFASYLLVWIFALLLRVTASWRYVLEIAFALALLFVFFLYWLIPDLNQIYTQYLLELYQNSDTITQNSADVQNFIQLVVSYLLGVQTSLYVLHMLFSLAIARGMQAVMFNPGGFSQDAKLIRLNIYALIVSLIFAGLALTFSYDWAWSAFPVLITAYTIAGLSLIHYLVKQKVKFKGAIFLFYVLFVLLFPFSLIPLILLAAIDTLWNIRRFL
jgi:hypothetical protein